MCACACGCACGAACVRVGVGVRVGQRVCVCVWGSVCACGCACTCGTACVRACRARVLAPLSSALAMRDAAPTTRPPPGTNQYIITGDSGQGMTGGTLGGMIVADAILGERRRRVVGGLGGAQRGRRACARAAPWAPALATLCLLPLLLSASQAAPTRMLSSTPPPARRPSSPWQRWVCARALVHACDPGRCGVCLPGWLLRCPPPAPPLPPLSLSAGGPGRAGHHRLVRRARAAHCDAVLRDGARQRRGGAKGARGTGGDGGRQRARAGRRQATPPTLCPLLTPLMPLPGRDCTRWPSTPTPRASSTPLARSAPTWWVCCNWWGDRKGDGWPGAATTHCGLAPPPATPGLHRALELSGEEF